MTFLLRSRRSVVALFVSIPVVHANRIQSQLRSKPKVYAVQVASTIHIPSHDLSRISLEGVQPDP